VTAYRKLSRKLLQELALDPKFFVTYSLIIAGLEASEVSRLFLSSASDMISRGSRKTRRD
jgi:hypothetical protein